MTWSYTQPMICGGVHVRVWTEQFMKICIWKHTVDGGDGRGQVGTPVDHYLSKATTCTVHHNSSRNVLWVKHNDCTSAHIKYDTFYIGSACKKSWFRHSSYQTLLKKKHKRETLVDSGSRANKGPHDICFKCVQLCFHSSHLRGTESLQSRDVQKQRCDCIFSALECTVGNVS